jgi:hypothetical protein
VQPVKRFLFWLIPSDKFVQVGESNGETASFDLAKVGIKRAYGIRIIDNSGRLRDKQANLKHTWRRCRGYRAASSRALIRNLGACLGQK